jgi:hypothetical protein
MNPKVGDFPKHEVAVQLVEAIAGIEQSRAEAGALLVAGVAVLFSLRGVNLGVRHPIRTNSSPKSLVA